MDETNNAYPPLSEEEKEAVDNGVKACLALVAVFGSTLALFGEVKLGVTTKLEDESVVVTSCDNATPDTQEPEPDEPENEEETGKNGILNPKLFDPEFIKENPDPNNQLTQICTLLHPTMKKLFGETSALYGMFHHALLLRGFSGETIEEQIHGADRFNIVSTWILTKQTFAIYHYDDLFIMLQAIPLSTNPEKVKPLNLSEITDRDINTITGLIERRHWKQDPILAEQIRQIKASDTARIPLAKAYWQQPELARIGKEKPVEVSPKPVIKDTVMITNSAGQPLELTGFDLAVQAAIGQMFQENGNVQITASPATIYRKCAGLDSGAAVSQKDIKATTESLLKMMDAKVSLVYEEHLDQFKKSHKAKGSKQPDIDYKVSRLDGTLINVQRLRSVAVSPNGRILSDTFTIVALPILYKYSYTFKQIMDVNTKYLAPALTKATPDNVAFARYILAQINRMQKEAVKENKMQLLTFETIAKRSTCDISSRAKLRNFQKKVIDYINSLVDLEYIKKADLRYDGKKLVGIDIMV